MNFIIPKTEESMKGEILCGIQLQKNTRYAGEDESFHKEITFPHNRGVQPLQRKER